MKFNNPSSAISYLRSHDNLETPSAGTVIIRGSVNGLSSCSAIDYLNNHSSYKVILTKEKVVGV